MFRQYFYYIYRPHLPVFFLIIKSCFLLPKVVGTCFVRKAMDKIFTQYELSHLDDLMPGDDKNKEEDEKKGFYDVCCSYLYL